LKHFTKVKGIATINGNASRDKDQDALFRIVTGLDVNGLYRVRQSPHTLQFLNNGLSSLHLIALKGHHTSRRLFWKVQ
jgi:hypothetical protein